MYKVLFYVWEMFLYDYLYSVYLFVRPQELLNKVLYFSRTLVFQTLDDGISCTLFSMSTLQDTCISQILEISDEEETSCTLSSTFNFLVFGCLYFFLPFRIRFSQQIIGHFLIMTSLRCLHQLHLLKREHRADLICAFLSVTLLWMFPSATPFWTSISRSERVVLSHVRSLFLTFT